MQNGGGEDAGELTTEQMAEMAKWKARANAKPKEVSHEEAEQWNLGSRNLEEAKKLNETADLQEQLSIRDRLREAAGLPIGTVKVEKPSTSTSGTGVQGKK